MALMYKDAEYAADRLSQCIVRHKGKPVFVEEFNGNWANVMVLGGDYRHEEVLYTDLDLTPVPLGMMNTHGCVLFTRRVPKRRDWRQGLRTNNFSHEVVIGEAPRGTFSLTSKALANTIMGVYPCPYDCINMIECGEVQGAAFSRHFAIGKKLPEGYKLYHRTNFVGTVRLGADMITVNASLDEKYKFLQEFLAEEMKIV